MLGEKRSAPQIASDSNRLRNGCGTAGRRAGPKRFKFVTTTIVLGYRPPLRGVSRALRARNPRRVSRGRKAPGSKKCPKQSRKSLRSLKTVFFETPESLPRLFRTLLGPWGRNAPGDSFGDSSGIPGPKGPGDSSKGRTVSQPLWSKRPDSELDCRKPKK